MRSLSAKIACMLLAFTCSLAVAQPSETPDPVKAMTFNIRFGTANDGENSWQHRYQMVFDLIEAHDAGIVGLQEALDFQIREITEAVPGYAVIGVGRDDGRTKGEYTAILYDSSRFAVDASGTFWLSDTPEEVASTTWGNSITRICTWARLIDLDSGNGLYVFNAHLDHVSQPSREKSTALIAQRVSQRKHEDPVIVMGDFNAGENNPAISSLLSNNDAALVNAYRQVRPDEEQVGTFNSFRGRNDGEMIDHLFVTKGIRVIGAGIDRTNHDGSFPSDHYPVWAMLDLAGAEE